MRQCWPSLVRSRITVERTYADKGYKGHDYEGPRPGHAFRAKKRPHAPNETRAQATIGY